MATTRDMLGTLGVSDAAARIFRYFLIRPKAHPRARELQRTLDLGGASIQRELERMIELGALEKVEAAGRTQYRVVEDAAIWKAMRILAEASTDPRSFLQDALADVSGVHAAFIFGSSVTGGHRPDSDVDVLVVEGSTADMRKLHRNLAEAGMLLGREMNVVRYTPQALADRLGNPQHPAAGFVRQVMSGPKYWIAGAASALMPLATAAGLSPEELMGTPG